MCTKCECTIRNIWPPSTQIPDMITVSSGNWILLKRCRNCNALWVESAYEPYASFRYLVLWKYSETDWIYLNSIDDSKTLLEWHKQEIKDNWKKLSIQDQQLIEKHRERAYHQYDPIDLPTKERVDISKLIKQQKS
jgi:hypothetical protein